MDSSQLRVSVASGTSAPLPPPLSPLQKENWSFKTRRGEKSHSRHPLAASPTGCRCRGNPQASASLFQLCLLPARWVCGWSYPCLGSLQKATFRVPLFVLRCPSQPSTVPAFSVSCTQEVERTMQTAAPKGSIIHSFTPQMCMALLLSAGTVPNRNLPVPGWMNRTPHFIGGETEAQEGEETAQFL